VDRALDEETGVVFPLIPDHQQKTVGRRGGGTGSQQQQKDQAAHFRVTSPRSTVSCRPRRYSAAPGWKRDRPQQSFPAGWSSSAARERSAAAPPRTPPGPSPQDTTQRKAYKPPIPRYIPYVAAIQLSEVRSRIRGDRSLTVAAQHEAAYLRKPLAPLPVELTRSFSGSSSARMLRCSGVSRACTSGLSNAF